MISNIELFTRGLISLLFAALCAFGWYWLSGDAKAEQDMLTSAFGWSAFLLGLTATMFLGAWVWLDATKPKSKGP